jgi:hypothetical protein
MSKPTINNLHQKAASIAKQYLVDKYNAEYKAIYRAQVVALGGNCHPTDAERIARLQAQIKLLESKGV